MRSYRVEGVSRTGRTSVCQELHRRGFQAINGDRELADQGDPGRPAGPATLFRGGSRNFTAFIDLFETFILEASEARSRPSAI